MCEHFNDVAAVPGNQPGLCLVPKHLMPAIEKCENRSKDAKYREQLDSIRSTTRGRFREAATNVWLKNQIVGAHATCFSSSAAITVSFFSSWYSVSVLMAQMLLLSVLPLAMFSTAVIAVSIEWSWLL